MTFNLLSVMPPVEWPDFRYREISLSRWKHAMFASCVCGRRTPMRRLGRTPIDGNRRFRALSCEPALERRRFDRLLELLEGADLDLADALVRDAVFLRQILKRGRLLAQPAMRQDIALALVEMAHGLDQEVAAQAELLAVAELGLLAFALVDQP